MYALVDFIDEKEKSKDGTIPCEIVRFSWLSSEQATCSWPGKYSYASAFNKAKIPGPNWRSCPVKVKFISDQLGLVQEQRDKFLDKSKVDTSMDEQRVRKKQSLAQLEISSGSESDSPVRHQTGMQRIVLPDLPIILMTSASTVGATASEIALEIEKEILRKVKMLINKVDGLTIEVRGLKVASNNVAEEEFVNVSSLPVKTVEAVNNYDVYLQTEGATKKVAAIIAKVGGTSIKDATERVLARIFSNSLAVEYNWRGTLYKDKPSKLPLKEKENILNLIRTSARIITCGRGTDHEIEVAIKNWLKNAKARRDAGVTLSVTEAVD
ncbi:unnamed protein product [Allacma fusca]|uniref:DUF4806 domain-containing protein n=1 Tax=Allacma fusca TaxID=39272 RepID=A0A8J2K8P0_9HEXA|nr:unnamed protein product [Allacma fusca]